MSVTRYLSLIVERKAAFEVRRGEWCWIEDKTSSLTTAEQAIEVVYRREAGPGRGVESDAVATRQDAKPLSEMAYRGKMKFSRSSAPVDDPESGSVRVPAVRIDFPNGEVVVIRADSEYDEPVLAAINDHMLRVDLASQTPPSTTQWRDQVAASEVAVWWSRTHGDSNVENSMFEVRAPHDDAPMNEIIELLNQFAAAGWRHLSCHEDSMTVQGPVGSETKPMRFRFLLAIDLDAA